MKTLVFGGSFDPPHKGHAALLKAAIGEIRPDRVVVVPAYQAPLKGMPAASAADRVAMTRLALGKLGKLDLSEIRRGRRVYTVDTLSKMRGERHFVVGSDAAASFRRWKNPMKLRRLAAWWAGRRPDSPRPPSFFRIVPGKMPAVSSTELRRRLALGEPVTGLLSPQVEAYIRRRGLYGCAIAPRLERELKPGRYEHTLRVAELADELAARHGLDRTRARLAGLLHDCGRAVPAGRMGAYAISRRLKVPALKAIVARNPLLLHAFIGEDRARRDFKIADKEVLAAIRNHTLGRARMGPLERLLYVADANSKDRRHPQAKRTRKLARKNLDAAFRKTVKLKLRHVAREGGWAHPSTRSLWNSLRAA